MGQDDRSVIREFADSKHGASGQIRIWDYFSPNSIAAATANCDGNFFLLRCLMLATAVGDSLPREERRIDFAILRAPEGRPGPMSRHEPSAAGPISARGAGRMNRSELETTAKAMVAKGKGILAADESSGTIKKRFDGISLESTEEARRTYRELLFTTPKAADYISGVIFYDETLRQKTKDGTPFPQYLSKLGIVPGIKVDTGAKPLTNFPKETITEGLDGLRERLAEYYGLGARFAKWRAVIDIADGIPSQFAIDANAHALARYAALCQEANIVPIVEPEVLMDGGHSIERCEEVTSATLSKVFAATAFTPYSSRRHDSETQHGHLGQEGSDACQSSASRRSDGADIEALCTGRGPGHRVPFRWSGRR